MYGERPDPTNVVGGGMGTLTTSQQDLDVEILLVWFFVVIFKGLTWEKKSDLKSLKLPQTVNFQGYMKVY